VEKQELQEFYRRFEHGKVRWDAMTVLYTFNTEPFRSRVSTHFPDLKKFGYITDSGELTELGKLVIDQDSSL
jgi:hypothetical protein